MKDGVDDNMHGATSVHVIEFLRFAVVVDEDVHKTTLVHGGVDNERRRGR